MGLEQAETGSSANSYAIIAKLATGGMADIFLARTQSGAGVERYVVLKRVLRHRATDIKFVHMFLDEAKLAARLQHPNIAQVYDTGKLGDSYFFTMEYVHGETVRELLHRAYETDTKIPLACALTIVAGAAAGLQHAHERVDIHGNPLGIVHRDVSPSNLMISYEGNVKLVDFGVAKASVQSIETQEGTVKGKIGYMAPEQCRGGNIDPRCDLFSLGIVMWELLTGVRLFKRNTEFESMEAIVMAQTPPPSSERPEIPKAVDDITLKLLSKRPDDRYQTADEVLEAIEVAAINAHVALSVPALKRFVRELFGQRPEPWLEMRLRDVAPEIVTVTGLPAKEHADELRLAHLPDLSNPAIAIGSSPDNEGTKSTTVVEMHDGVARAPSAPSLRAPSTRMRAPTAPTVSGEVANVTPAAVDAFDELGVELAPSRSRRGVVIGIGAVLIACVAIALVMFAGSSSDHATGDVTSPGVGSSEPSSDQANDPPPQPVADPGSDVAKPETTDTEPEVTEPDKTDIAEPDQTDIVEPGQTDKPEVEPGKPSVTKPAPAKPPAVRPKIQNKKIVRRHPHHTVNRTKPLDTLPKLDPKHTAKTTKTTKTPPKPKCDPSDPMSCRE